MEYDRPSSYKLLTLLLKIYLLSGNRSSNDITITTPVDTMRPNCRSNGLADRVKSIFKNKKILFSPFHLHLVYLYWCPKNHHELYNFLCTCGVFCHQYKYLHYSALLQKCRWIFQGASSNVVGIICPPC